MAENGPPVAKTAGGGKPGPICALRNVSKTFGSIQACEDITLEFFSGEIVAIAGENGAGKSTLSKCLYGLYAPNQGHVEVDGNPVTLSSPSDGESAGIVMIPQELDLFPELSIVNNIWMGQDRPRTVLGGFDYAGHGARSARADADAGGRHRCAAAGKPSVGGNRKTGRDSPRAQRPGAGRHHG